jgi:hypothetical protein
MRIEHELAPWVTFGILPLFGFANAGLSFVGLSLSTVVEPVPLGMAAGQSPMGRGARRQQDHPESEVKSPDSPVISGEEQAAPRCGQRNPSSSATKRMNQQAPGVVRPNSTRDAQREHSGFRTLC